MIFIYFIIIFLMFQVCKYCHDCDLQVHVPDLSIDIRKAVESGVVSQPPVIQDFNNLDIDMVSNGYRLREVFDAVENSTSVSQFTSEFSSGTGNSLVSQSTPPSEGSGN